MVSLAKLTKKGRTLILAYDQGLEHGPEQDFNDKNVDPLYIIDIGKKAKVQALAFQKGIAEKYHKEIKASKIPLIIKLNGKTKLTQGEPYSPLICTVEEAKDLGAAAVGYTVYLGSERFDEAFEELGEIVRQAHEKKMPVVVWVYPRGKAIKNDVSRENMAYATRMALELGADIVKIKYGGKKADLKWAVKAAGRTKVVIAGGAKDNEKDFLKDAKDIMDAGAIGFAIGRNVWQHSDPVAFTKKLQKIVYKK